MSKIYEKAGRPFRSDYSLVTEYQDTKSTEALHELWDKYDHLRLKKKGELNALAKRHNFEIADDLQNWDAEAWVKFINQMPGVERERIKNPDTWTIYIRLNGYWNSMNRDIIHALIKSKKHLLSSSSYDKDEEKEYQTNRMFVFKEDKDRKVYQSLFNSALAKTFSEISQQQKSIFNMKGQKMPITEISKKLNISPNDIRFSLKEIKKSLSKNIELSSLKDFGKKISYSEMVELLS